MSPDELPERDYFQLSYGDLHYRVTIQGPIMTRDYLKYQIMAHASRAMREFHGKYHAAAEREAGVRQLLYKLAARYPEVGRDQDFNQYVRTGEVY